jgi:CelD/BcsL family acetyltransferase involved in cellulose biosynthesis
MLEAIRIDSLDGLAGLEPDWWALWRASGTATPFQSPAWLIPWWRAFSPGRLASVAIRRDGRLVALAPLYLEDGALGRRVLPLGIGISDYLDVLLDPRDETAAALLASAIAALDDWDSIELEQLPPDAAALGLPCLPGCAETGAAQDASPGLAIGAAVDASGIPVEVTPKRRQSYRRKLRMAEAHPPVEIAAAEPGCFIDALAALHGARWRQKGEPGIFADPRVVAFHREAVPALLAAGLARLTTLSLGGRLAGALYCLAWRDSIATYVSGFDPDFAAESPLTLLVGDMFRHAAATGIREVSFLRGREPYKYLWGATDRWNRRRSFRRAA